MRTWSGMRNIGAKIARLCVFRKGLAGRLWSGIGLGIIFLRKRLDTNLIQTHIIPMRVRRPARQFPTLKHWRAAAGLNTREAGLVLGMSQSTYSRLERGDRTAVGAKAKRIMSVTGVPIEALVGLDEVAR